jgi:hypothetical protein
VKNTIKALVIALTSLAFSGVSFAQAKPATPTAPAAPAMEKSEKAKTNGVTGEVTSVDVKAGTFTVKAKDKRSTWSPIPRALKLRWKSSR